MVQRGNRVLPDQGLLRHERAERARDRAHVAVRELEPGAGERVGELIGMLVEAPRDLLVGRVEPQREIGGQHGRLAFFCLVEGVGDRRLPILGLPLLRSRGTFRQLPFILEQVLEEEIAPLRWRLRPDDFGTAGYRIGAKPGAVLALPAETLVFEGAAFRLRPDQRWIAGAVRLAKAVPAG